MAVLDKTYQYKVYSASNVFLGVWNDVISDLSFDQEVYSAGSSINVELSRNSDTKIITLENINHHVPVRI